MKINLMGPKLDTIYTEPEQSNNLHPYWLDIIF